MSKEQQADAWRPLCAVREYPLSSVVYARLDRIEAAITPKGEPLPCIVFDSDDEDAVVARFRAERNWPDDGAHPIRVLRVEFVKGGAI